MDAEPSIWQFPLEQLQEMILAGDSITGGVAVAAISASLAISVLAMALDITGRKHGSEAVKKLRERAGGVAHRLVPAADEDRAAYAAFLDARRLAHDDPARAGAVDAALLRATRTPLTAARAAADGLGICADAKGLVAGDVAADVTGAAALLLGAVQAMLVSADANLLRLRQDPAYPQLVSERSAIEQSAAACFTRVQAG